MLNTYMLKEEYIRIKNYEEKQGILHIWGDYSENMVFKEYIISMKWGCDVFPRYINVVLGASLILTGLFSLILIALLHPVASISAFFSIIFGFLALVREFDPDKQKIRAYRLLGILLILLGLLPTLRFPSFLPAGLFFMILGIALSTLKIQYYCEIELQTGRKFIITGDKELLERLWQDISATDQK